jgi:hypothetical protein
LSSNIHGLKNRPYLRPAVAEAFKSWHLLEVASHHESLYPDARTEIRVFLSWLMVDCGGALDDLEWLEQIGILTDDDVIDWETWASL